MPACVATPPSMAPSANHVPDGASPLQAGQPLPSQAAADVHAPSHPASARLLASPFATMAAQDDLNSEVESDVISGESPQAPAAAVAVANEVTRAAEQPAKTTVEERASSTPLTKARAGGAARPDQDYAIVEAPLSLRRPGSMPPPEQATQQPLQGPAARSVAGGGGGPPQTHLTQPPGDHYGLEASQLDPTLAPPRSAELALQTDTSERPPRGAHMGGELLPESTVNAVNVVANLRRLRVSGPCSCGDRLETASSTPVSFTSAAST